MDKLQAPVRIPGCLVILGSPNAGTLLTHCTRLVFSFCRYRQFTDSTSICSGANSPSELRGPKPHLEPAGEISLGLIIKSGGRTNPNFFSL